MNKAEIRDKLVWVRQIKQRCEVDSMNMGQLRSDAHTWESYRLADEIEKLLLAKGKKVRK